MKSDRRFEHDLARSKAYRWGEDGIGGISDRRQFICFALSLWNGRDPILKERLFGLTGSEGNHGEDVKEYYFYLDSTPTHSYMKFLYKYPQAEFPYSRLVEENRRRGEGEPEFELLDTGVLDEDRYFDVFIEYAKATPEDILIRITATNRGPEPAELHLLPTIWFRNTWSWEKGAPRPSLRKVSDVKNAGAVKPCHEYYGHRWLFCQGRPEVLFTENETNTRRLYGHENGSRLHKDQPYRLDVGGKEYRVDYEPAESTTGLFGGNSNWRGPIWFPVNYLIIESLQKFHHYLGDEYKVECPTGSGQMMTLWEVSAEISRRLTRIFLRDPSGRRPVFGGAEKFQADPHWRDYVPFHEYFHGDNGAGVGASHQTGWTALVAKLIQQSGE